MGSGVETPTLTKDGYLSKIYNRPETEIRCIELTRMGPRGVRVQALLGAYTHEDCPPFSFRAAPIPGGTWVRCNMDP